MTLGCDPKEPNTFQLCDAVDSMAERALATSALMQNQFLSQDATQSSDEINFNALDSINLELKDIQKTIKEFNEHWGKKRVKPSCKF